MRPVRLDLNGFASFRDQVTVDFAGADYFAFVGPTGSGKSTIIDAMTFALYGSAPRWGSSSSIQYALAPTANRCTVRLVFDVGGQRYVVGREVRRSGASISQRNCSLERYLDPAAAGDPELDEPTEIVAENPPATKQQVSELLGLDFDDFCTCVVLPQGEFADFLQASVTERQAILLKLLGAKHYDAIGKLAGRRATDAGIRVDLLAGQLGELADATEDAEATARARESELAAVEPIVAESVRALTAAAGRVALVRGQLDVTTAEGRLLGAVAVPAGVTEVQRAVTQAEETYREASGLEREAIGAAQGAQRAAESGPQRRPIEDALGWHRERADGRGRLGGIAEAAQEAARERAEAEAAAAAAEEVLGERRLELTAADAAAGAARAALETLDQRIEALSSVRPPDGVAELGSAAESARRAQWEAASTVQTLAAELADAQTAIDGLPERSALDELGRTIAAYVAAADTVGRLTARRDEAAVERAAAGVRLAQAERDRDQARERLEALRGESAAADLRPRLRVGHSCPVCDQTVATLPPRLDAPQLDGARAALEDTDRAVNDARRDDQAATAELASCEARLSSAVQVRDQLDGALTGRLPDNRTGADRDPAADRAAHADLIERLGTALSRQAAVGGRLAGARTAAEDAASAQHRVDEDAARARGELHATLGRLSAEQPPAVDATDLAGAWAALSGWAADRTATLGGTDLPAEQQTLATATAELTRTKQAADNAAEADRLAGGAQTAAALAAQRAALAHDQLLDRLGELDALLADQPGPTELAAALADCDRLAAEAQAAREAARTATTARQAAETARDESRHAWQQAQRAFRTARERLIPLGVPPWDDADLAGSWNALLSWSAAEAEHRREQADTLAAEIVALDAEVATGTADLASTLESHALDPSVPADQVVATVMVERERARGRTAEVVRRRSEAAGLRASIDTLTETHRVAKELQTLMSSRKFPQWLADAALDTLVADASASLMRLSNDQFDLTHDKGEFFVIDHADADSRRSVRTLSGGETFQASLALALALSEQLSTLAAGGRTTLDSIFLDEGFGTLDGDALEIVAGTLENLAQEDRMVGVITHVTALAERVPVRFAVSRDARTSSVERV